MMETLNPVASAITGTWIIGKEFTFEACHQLPFHDGKCANIHGHSYKGRVFLSATELATEGPKTGMVVDFADVKAAIAPLVDKYLDHHDLNDSLGVQYTTAEYLSKWLYDNLAPTLPNIIGVEIDETATSTCFYLDPAKIKTIWGDAPCSCSNSTSNL